MTFLISLKILAFMFFTVHGLKMIPESLKIVYYNKKYIADPVANIRRFARNGDYYLNFYGVLKHAWDNNVTVHIIVTQYLHNEYRRSFIEFHYRFCDLVNKEPMFGNMMRQKGLVCPTPRGRYSLTNMTVQSQDFPNVWPFEKGGLDLSATATDTGELIGEGYVHLLFKDLRNKG